MCGICGILQADPTQGVDGELLKRMTRVLGHRGPDDDGLVFFDRRRRRPYVDTVPSDSEVAASVGLGHRRLQIIDIESGRQPMSNETGDIWIVFNGEIYNFKELRRHCEGGGHHFKTESDTEVILHLYEMYGTECLKHLEGMFAFGLFDGRDGTMLLARDRLGQKPLYYSADDRRLLFASELKSMLQDPTLPRNVDTQSLHDYLTFLSVPTPRTIFEGVSKLEAGHFVIWRDGKIRKQAYWQLSTAPSTTHNQSNPDQLLDHLRRSVRQRLISDVPLGAFLSGGVDSSAVVALMAEVSDEPVKTFSVGFQGRQHYDESPYAEAVARHLGAEHHNLTVRPDILNDLSSLVYHWDEPFAVSSAIPLYYLSKLAREHVSVVLTGDGADEQLAGYTRYWWDRSADKLSSMPQAVWRVAERVSAVLPSSAASATGNQVRRVNKFFQSMLMDPDSRYLRYFTFFSEAEKADLYSDEYRAELKLDASPDVVSRHYNGLTGGRLDRRLHGDIKTTLMDEMLTKVDKMSMAVGLEARAPFMDHTLVEFIARLPESAKLDGRLGKAALKRSLAGIIPSQHVYRKKHGFEVPIDEWLRTELLDFTMDLLSAERIRRRGIFSHTYVARLLQTHMSGYRNVGHKIWILLMFELWCVRFLDASERS